MRSRAKQERAGRRGSRWLVACGLPVILLAAATTAHAGTYSVAMCDLGAGPAYFAKAGNQAKFKIDNDCTNGGTMRVRDGDGGQQSNGDDGGWAVESGDAAPSWLAPTRVSFRAAGKSDKGLRPYIEAKRRGQGGWSQLAGDKRLPGASLRSYSFAGPFTRLRVVLRCTWSRCGQDSAAFVRLKAVRWQVFEGAGPVRPRLGGMLMQQPAQRGLQSVGAGTGDGESGVFATTVQVNGTLLTTLPGSCAMGGRDTSGRISLGRWRPCTNDVAGATTNTNDGTAGPFREGLNRIRTCSSDFAGNSACGGWQQVRVDNRCPIAPPGDTATSAARLAASFGNGKKKRRVGYPSRPRIRAQLRDTNGQPLATSSASICATEKVALARRPGAKLVTPSIPSGGSVKAPPGSSRTIWLNYWLDGERVVSARLKLRARPDLGLKARPNGTLHNGDTLRLRAKLRGPFAGGRKVIFKVQAGGERQRLGADRTNRRGVAKVQHRFSQIQGTGTIRVRAYVPGQRSFPYLRGRSPSRTVHLAP